jgi:hypothetical protein
MTSNANHYTDQEFMEYLKDLPENPIQLAVFAHARLSIADSDTKERFMLEDIIDSCRKILHNEKLPVQIFPELFQ